MQPPHFQELVGCNIYCLLVDCVQDLTGFLFFLFQLVEVSSLEYRLVKRKCVCISINTVWYYHPAGIKIKHPHYL